MKKSIPLSVTVAEQSPAPSPAILFNQQRAWVMGVLNATPDSFYAGSRTAQVEAALHRAEEMIDDGAAILDIGGESTRPGAEAVTQAEELNRVLPVLDALHLCWPDHLLSVDTQKAEVARQALARGAHVINDISALRSDPAMADVLAPAGCPVVLMHMQGEPATMQAAPRYQNIIDDIKAFFVERLRFAGAHGISEERIILDPGIGFGKTLEHNLEILRRLEEFKEFGRPILVGVSRKSFVGKLLASAQNEPLPPENRLEGSLAAGLWAVAHGANGLRVHDVAPTCRALRVWEGIQAA